MAAEPKLDLAGLRREYTRGGLRRTDLDPNPLLQFQKWFEQALTADLAEPSAMTLATADAAGRPSARIVLLKAVDQRGFVFFTNYESRKGRELAENPRGALAFYWPELERQVCVAGAMAKVADEESEEYFQKRPRGAQLGAWVSKQSSVVMDRGFLEQRLAEVDAQFAERVVERPAYWGGYVLEPCEIEFWQGRPNRLHDRFHYLKQPDGSWLIQRLSP